MAWIEKRGKKRIVRWREGDKVHSRSPVPNTPEAARILRNEIERQVLRGTLADADARKQPFGEYARTLFEGDLALRSSTRHQYLRHLEKHLAPRLGPVAMEDLQPARVRAAMADLHAKAGPWVARECHKLLSKICRQALVDGILARNPLEGSRAPKVERRQIRILTPGEVDAVATWIEPRYHALVLLSAWGGFRIGELGALERQDIDFDRNTITVRRAVSKGAELVIGPPKTKASRRTVSMPTWVLRELAEHLIRYTPGSGRVFTTEAGGIVNHENIWHHWRKACKAAKLEPIPRFHDLRHTAVSILIAQGAHPKLIQARVGHSSISITMDVYGHLFPTADAELAASLEKFKPQEAEVIEL